MTAPLQHPQNEARDVALAWFARWRSGRMTAAQQDEAEAWLSLNPANRDAFEEIAAIWDGLGPARQDPAIMTLREQATRLTRRTRLLNWIRPAAAILVVAVMGFGGVRWFMSTRAPAPIVYATRVGETSTMSLADGSKVILDTDSVVKVWPRMVTERRIELVRGRAFFEVAKDRRRPFIVQTDRGSVTALGTAFDVRRDAAGMKIVLLEGRVRVEPTVASGPKGPTKPMEMAAGYEFVGDGATWRLKKTDSAAETSWIRGDLIFDEQPLSVIANELNRYGAEKIVIGDPEVGRRRLSAVLKAGDTRLFLASVQTLRLAAVERSSNEVTLSSPQ